MVLLQGLKVSKPSYKYLFLCIYIKVLTLTADICLYLKLIKHVFYVKLYVHRVVGVNESDRPSHPVPCTDD